MANIKNRLHKQGVRKQITEYANITVNEKNPMNIIQRLDSEWARECKEIADKYGIKFDPYIEVMKIIVAAISNPNGNDPNILKILLTVDETNLDLDNINGSISFLPKYGALTTQMFKGAADLYYIPKFNASCRTNADNLFKECYNLLEIPELDLTNCTSAEHFADNCENLKVCKAKFSNKLTTCNSMFYNCNACFLNGNTLTIDFGYIISPVEAYNMFDDCDCNLNLIYPIDLNRCIDVIGAFRYIKENSKIKLLNTNTTTINAESAFEHSEIPYIETNSEDGHIFENATSVESCFDTSKVNKVQITKLNNCESACSVYNNCNFLEIPDLYWYVKYCQYAFKNCEIETAGNIILISENVDEFFKECNKLTTINSLKIYAYDEIVKGSHILNSLENLTEINEINVNNWNDNLAIYDTPFSTKTLNRICQCWRLDENATNCKIELMQYQYNELTEESINIALSNGWRFSIEN